MLGALACGGETPEQAPAPRLPDSGDSGQGRVVMPAEGPECTSGYGSPFMQVALLGVSGGNVAFDGHVVARGVGLAEGMTEWPWGANGAEDVGWLLLEETSSLDAGVQVEIAASLDAGSQHQDASSIDAGSQREAAASADAGAGAVVGRRWTLVGPREIGEMPVPAGEPLHVAMNEPQAGVYNPRHYEIVATLGERVVMFQQRTQWGYNPNSHDGFLLERGAIVCHRTNKQLSEGVPCHYDYYHVLDVTVPGGAVASLGLGERRTVGGYHLLHGTTTSLSPPAVDYRQVYGECNDILPAANEFTAILASDAL
jgi:hypothetical protein